MNAKSKARVSAWTEIFWVFFRIGPSTFGGGYAMIPVIEREIVQRRGWLEPSDLADMVSVAGSAPGGMGVNSAAYIGYRKAGTMGAVMAVLGITLPTFVLVFLLSLFYSKFENHPKIEAALHGVHGAIIALILIAAYKMATSSIYDKATASIAVVTLGLLLLTPIHPLSLIAGGIVSGVILVKAKKKLGMSARTEKEPSDEVRQELRFPEYYI